MEYTYQIEGGNFLKAGTVSSEVKKLLKKVNIPPQLIKKTVVALYEAEVNIVAHAYNGKLVLTISPKHIELYLEDKGPGIADINKAMEDGYSTASKEVQEMGFGAGMGLSNIKKNSDDFSIDSKVQEGTTVKIINYIT